MPEALPHWPAPFLCLTLTPASMPLLPPRSTHNSEETDERLLLLANRECTPADPHVFEQNLEKHAVSMIQRTECILQKDLLRTR